MRKISWTPPAPRRGFAGEWDKFIGPGATRAELWLILLPALLAGIAAPVYAWQQALDWTGWQLLTASLLALDLVGGVTANATTAAKRWYHRDGQGWLAHLRFTAVHIFHLALVAWLFAGGDWGYLALSYGYLLLAAWGIIRSPLRLQRPLAMLLYLGSLLLALYVLPTLPGLEWFLPVFYLKLLLSHLVQEAPFYQG
jgi:hypothetical protein